MNIPITPPSLKSLLALPALLLLIPVLAMPLLLPQPFATLSCPLCVGTTDLMLRKLKSVVLPASGQETN